MSKYWFFSFNGLNIFFHFQHVDLICIQSPYLLSFNRMSVINGSNRTGLHMFIIMPLFCIFDANIKLTFYIVMLLGGMNRNEKLCRQRDNSTDAAGTTA